MNRFKRCSLELNEAVQINKVKSENLQHSKFSDNFKLTIQILRKTAYLKTVKKNLNMHHSTKINQLHHSETGRNKMVET